MKGLQQPRGWEYLKGSATAPMSSGMSAHPLQLVSFQHPRSAAKKASWTEGGIR
jgi:hypothetical protein